jgi:6-phosphogluconolactonase (cycloisomerase 2 family)
MKKSALILLILFLSLALTIFYFKPIAREPKTLVARSSFGKKGKNLGEFQSVTGLAIKDKYLFIADSGNNRIQVFRINSDGSLSPHSAFGKEGNGLGELSGFPILNLAIKDKYLFIADSGNNRIQVFRINSDGSLSPQFAFGKEGHHLGEFAQVSNPLLGKFPHPLNLSIKDRYLFVTDPGNSRIQVFQINLDGILFPKFVFGKAGSRLGEFNMPFSLTVKDNYLFVADSGNYRIQVFRINPNGSLSYRFAFGEGLRELGAILTAAAIDEHYLFVSDTRNARIQVLEIKY